MTGFVLDCLQLTSIQYVVSDKRTNVSFDQCLDEKQNVQMSRACLCSTGDSPAWRDSLAILVANRHMLPPDAIQKLGDQLVQASHEVGLALHHPIHIICTSPEKICMAFKRAARGLCLSDVPEVSINLASSFRQSSNACETFPKQKAFLLALLCVFQHNPALEGWSSKGKQEICRHPVIVKKPASQPLLA